MFERKGWVPCPHCQNTAVCRNKIKAFQIILKFIPIPIRTSCASCLGSVGVDPSKLDLLVRCGVCKGSGYVWLNPKGVENAQAK